MKACVNTTGGDRRYLRYIEQLKTAFYSLMSGMYITIALC